MIKLSILAVLLGLGYGLPQIYGLIKPASFSAALRKFPRSTNWGVALILSSTAWFLYNMSQESIADFASSKNFLMLFFGLVGLGTCLFVRDFLAVRGLAVFMLLLAKLMVDSGRPALPSTGWTFVFQLWAYILVFFGMWLTISPWRLRNWINWTTANEQRIKTVCSLRLAFGLFVAVLGIARY